MNEAVVPKLKLLFSALKLRECALRNRIVCTAHSTGLTDGSRPQLRHEVEGALRSINEAGAGILLIDRTCARRCT
jgi:2,4-dienoyl-CoA reductase-like NADH-dependent reductase (Old Yellow Enzyme family)